MKSKENTANLSSSGRMKLGRGLTGTLLKDGFVEISISNLATKAILSISL